MHTQLAKLATLELEFLFKFEKVTDRNLVARFMIVMPQTLHLYAKNEKNGMYTPQVAVHNGY